VLFRSGVTIPTDVTLSGNTNDVWIFQIAQNLTVSSAARIILSGGAQPANIFWQVAGQTTIGTTAVFNGNILDQTAIVLSTGATLNGRALSQTAVTLDSNAVTVPNYTAPVVPSTPTDVSPLTLGSNNSSSNNNSDNSGTTTTTYLEGCTATTNYSATTGRLCTGGTSNIALSSVTYNFGTTTLKNGSKGEAVKELQRFLNAKLNLGLVVDGEMGPKTLMVVKEWQRENGLIADGFVGVKTKAKMNASFQ
jgi:hypothetical protein